MNRIQWFRVSPLDRKTARLLNERLLKMPYSKGSRMGFAIETVRADSIAGNFIERVDFVETITDPLGGEIQIQRVRFDTTEFCIYPDIEILECINPGRNLKNLLTELSKLTNFEIALTKAQIPLTDLMASLKRESKGFMVTKAVANDIELGDGVLCQLQASGAIDIRKHLQRFLKDKSYKLTRIRTTLQVEEESFSIEVASSGVAAANSPIGPKVRQLLRRALVSAGTKDAE